ncbi:MAG TPA: hypothetical protein VEN81_09905 [Planctomycetota bacterium]|nr:hypothetical protein [Planctomycetota bacterium]
MRVDAYTFHEAADLLVRRLGGAGREDKAAERTSKVLLVLAVLGWIAGGLLTVVAGMFYLLAVPIVLTVLYVRAKRHDLDDRKLATALKFFQVLRADIPSGEPVDLRIDFRSHQKGGRMVSKEAGKAGSRITVHEHGWFAARARLADGNDVQVAVTSDIIRKEKPKRKYTKVSERWTDTVEIVAKLREVYGDPSAIAGALRSSPPPRGLSVRRVVGGDGRLRATFETQEFRRTSGRSSSVAGEENRVDGDVLLGAMVWFYRGISGARKAA